MNSILEEPTTTPEPEEPPMSYDEAKLERLVFEAPPGLEPIKTKTRQMSREYMRQYYPKNKADSSCPFCNITYTCKSSLVKHQRRSTKCAIQRIYNTFSDYTETDDRVRSLLHKHEMQEEMKLVMRLAKKNKQKTQAEVI